MAQPQIVVACFLFGECGLRGRNSFAARVFSGARWTHLADRAATDRVRGIFVIRRDLLYQARALDRASARGMAGKKPYQWDLRLTDRIHSELLVNRVAFTSPYNRFHMRRHLK